MTYLPDFRTGLNEAAARRYGQGRKPTPRLPRLRWAAPVVLACVLLAAVGFVQWPDVTGAPEAPDVVTLAPAIPLTGDVPQATLDRSAELASRPPALSPEPQTEPPVSHPELPRVAAGFENVTPYPPGGDDQFAWERTPADPLQSGSITERWEIQNLVEHRAGCVWLQFWLAAQAQRADGPKEDAARVLGDVPNWPTIRGQGGGTSTRWREAAAAAARADTQAVGEFAPYCLDVKSPWNR